MKKLILLLLLLPCLAQAMVLRVVKVNTQQLEFELNQIGKITFQGSQINFVAKDGSSLWTAPASDIAKLTFANSPMALFSPELNYRVYPNPARDIVLIDGLNNPAQISLVDMNGHRVKSAQGNQLEVSDVAQGTYLLIVNNEVSKLIIE